MYPSAMNYCNLPPWAISSRHFNRDPQPLKIQGLGQALPDLLSRLNQLDDATERGAQFHDFMDVRFQLHQWEREETPSSRKALKNSYLRFLRGWLFDSNSVEGAVLKGWVESRLGLPPLFHNEPIGDIHSRAYFRYTQARMKGLARTNAIFSQLDLLYGFVQYELNRCYPETTHLTLYRGVYDFEEHHVLEKGDKGRFVLKLNNLNSFTDDFEKAWEFGSRVIEAEVPLPKVFFKSGLLPRSLLKGEGEVVVIGGEYEVKVLIGG
jgi:NAD+--dinitrogen-reductase ADP-D-ribosyltransferase